MNHLENLIFAISRKFFLASMKCETAFSRFVEFQICRIQLRIVLPILTLRLCFDIDGMASIIDFFKSPFKKIIKLKLSKKFLITSHL